jgi:hypothetical protein
MKKGPILAILMIRKTPRGRDSSCYCADIELGFNSRNKKIKQDSSNETSRQPVGSSYSLLIEGSIYDTKQRFLPLLSVSSSLSSSLILTARTAPGSFGTSGAAAAAIRNLATLLENPLFFENFSLIA